MSDENHDAFSKTLPNTDAAFSLEVWHEALSRALAAAQDEWAHARDLIVAKFEAKISELNATVAHYQREIVELQTRGNRVIGGLRDGADGPQGPQGMPGEIGPQGETGLRGERGERGERGAPGDLGPRGERGDVGERGEKGDQGERGTIGPQGEKGERGERGERGDKGDRGDLGEMGLRGEIGQSGPIGERGERGERGEKGDQGVRGEKGDMGIPGAHGERGERGLKGDPGERGERGLPGERGERGLDGKDGLSGRHGKDGKDGEKGEKGDRGPPGALPVAKTWRADEVYYRGDVCVLDGATWQAECDTGHAPPHSSWICLATAGVDAREPRHVGTFEASSANNYKRLDIVALGGGTFIAAYDAPGQCPGDGWRLMARQGQRGVAGDKGATGEKGEKGAKGEAGKDGTIIKSWKIDPDRYVAIPVMSDGKDGPALELRPLFQKFAEETEPE